MPTSDGRPGTAGGLCVPDKRGAFRIVPAAYRGQLGLFRQPRWLSNAALWVHELAFFASMS